MSASFTPSLFYKFSTCPHWIWHDFFGNPANKIEVPALAQKLIDQGVLHEEEYIKGLNFVSVTLKNSTDAFAATLALMQSGTDLIYQGEIQYEENNILYHGRPDLLEKRPGTSKFGAYYYAPIDIKSSSKLDKKHKLQLTLYATILEQMQGVFPEETAIINRAHERIPFTIAPKDRAETQKQMSSILAVMSGEKPPLKLAGSCKQSPWYPECVHDAEEAQDIALLYKLDNRACAALRAEGIVSIHDAAQMDIVRLPKIPFASQKILARVKVQAQSLLDGELKWLARPSLPHAPLQLYFDIEGDPLLGVDYLFGLWVCGDAAHAYAHTGHVRFDAESSDYFIYFVAETPEDEGAMWAAFLQWIEALPTGKYDTFHYADYERSHTGALAAKYGTSAAFEEFVTTYVDLMKVMSASVVLPLYFYSIKDIAKSRFLNFKWRHEKAGGAQSIFWYEEWLEKRDSGILKDIVDYNEDDVRATKALYGWLIT